MDTPAAEVATETTEAVTEPLPVEGAPVVEGEAPAEGVEGEKPPEPVKPAEIPEEVLKAAAVKHANATMAAARRAEARVEAVRTENKTLKSTVEVYEGFVAELKSNPIAAIRRIGFASVKEFLDSALQAGEPKAPTADDRVAELEKRIKERDEAEASGKRKAALDEGQQKVFAALDADKSRFGRTATRTGKARVWKEILSYHEMHKDVPDEAVFAIADAVERELREEFGEPISVPRQDATKQGAPAGNAAAAGRTSGKTLTNGSTSGAPKTREYSLDPDERRAQVTADMRAEGLL